VTKAEFVDRLAAKSGLTKKDAASVVDAFVEVVTDALKKGETFSSPVSASFTCRHARPARASIRRPKARLVSLPQGAQVRRGLGSKGRGEVTFGSPIERPGRLVRAPFSIRPAPSVGCAPRRLRAR